MTTNFSHNSHSFLCREHHGSHCRHSEPAPEIDEFGLRSAMSSRSAARHVVGGGREGGGRGEGEGMEREGEGRERGGRGEEEGMERKGEEKEREWRGEGEGRKNKQH